MSEHFISVPLPVTPKMRARVALLVDGENISCDYAGQVITSALKEGDLIVKRVYGDVGRMPKWTDAPGFRAIHSGSGKNATDLLLSVDAMAIMLTGQADVLCIAASDRDYVHLVDHLRERGVRVVGLGEAKSSERLRKSYSLFKELSEPSQAKVTANATKTPPNTGPVNVSIPKRPLQETVALLIRSEGDATGFKIGLLGARMHVLHKVQISTYPEKTWRKYLISRPSLFQCDPRGPNAKVRLSQGRASTP